MTQPTDERTSIQIDLGLSDEELEAMGGPLPLTDAQLDLLSIIDEADVLRTQIAWEEGVDRRYRNMLLAERE